jgi:hypothetical protein
MNFVISDTFMSGLLGDVGSGRSQTSGTVDDDDDRDDEHSGENEASVRTHDENTEGPEEFGVDEEDDLPPPDHGSTREIKRSGD